MRAAQIVGVALVLAAVLAVGTAAYRLAGTGRQIDAATRALGESRRPRDAVVETAPESAALRAPGREPARPPADLVDREENDVTNRRRAIDELEQLAVEDERPILAGEDTELRAAFDELLDDPDPEVRREARLLLEAWSLD